MDLSALGENIRRYRIKCGFSVAQLADFSYASSSSIRKYEAGVQVPHLSRFVAIANAIEVTPDCLLEGLIGKNEKSDLQTIEAYLAGQPSPELRRAKRVLAATVDYFERHSEAVKGIGSRIKSVREDSGHSVEEVASLCNITAGSFRQMESAQSNPTLECLVTLCNFLRVSPTYLLKDVLRKTEHWNDEMVERISRLTPTKIALLEHIVNIIVD